MAKYRLYIDESGTHNYSSSRGIGNKYLSLTGVILEDEDNRTILQPRLTEMKRLFTTDPDDLPVLHREELIAGRGPFNLLQDLEIKKDFNSKMLSLISDLPYQLCCVVLDKSSHSQRYGSAAYHPYHYCLSVMLERYVGFLDRINARGDVMAEARGAVEDHALKGEYRRFYEAGTAFRTSRMIQATLTSREIKIKPKGIVGLEFADLLTLATKLDVLAGVNEIAPLDRSNFLWKVVTRIQPKYYRGANGRIVGYGKKLVK